MPIAYWSFTVKGSFTVFFSSIHWHFKQKYKSLLLPFIEFAPVELEGNEHVLFISSLYIQWMPKKPAKTNEELGQSKGHGQSKAVYRAKVYFGGHSVVVAWGRGKDVMLASNHVNIRQICSFEKSASKIKLKCNFPSKYKYFYSRCKTKFRQIVALHHKTKSTRDHNFSWMPAGRLSRTLPGFRSVIMAQHRQPAPGSQILN